MTKRALLSVYRKEGIVDLARGLAERGFEILSTGGTAAELEKAGVKVTGVWARLRSTRDCHIAGRSPRESFRAWGSSRTTGIRWRFAVKRA